ncbi:MAG: PD-(D/E)XK nuclease family protein [Porticoccaceae bacterium]
MNEPTSSSSLTLTPNLPLAQQLRRARLIQRGINAAPSAPIEQLQQWLIKSIEPDLPMASDAQLRLIWEQVIAGHRDSDEQFRQLNPGVLAGRALTAWQSLKRWEIPAEELRKAETGQLIFFSDWITEFEQRLQSLGLTTLDLAIQDHLQSGPGNKSESVRLYAFIAPPPPLWQRWLSANFEKIEQPGYARQGAGQKQQNHARIAALDNPQKELQAALHWADGILQNDTRSRIAIIDFNLGDNLKSVQRLTHKNISASTPIHFGRELPLAKQGPVQTALALLQLNTHEIDLPTARLLAQSRLWGNFAQGYEARAHWDRNICELKQKTFGVTRFADAISDQPLRDFLAKPFANKRQAQQLLPLEHAARFQRQLEALGLFEVNPQFDWRTWEQALDEFSSLGHITGEIDTGEALRLLTRCASKPRAQSSPDGTGLYLLDTVEAAADFSHIWILGMNSQNWPGAPQPNPLLPVSLQARYQMPHVNAEQEAQLAQQLVQRLQQAADEVIFSYSRLQDDLEQTACALIADLPVFTPTTVHERPFNPATMEWLDCSQAPVVPEDERKISGYDGSGSALLQTMLASPFNAFAQWRLRATPLEEPQIGLSAADRGTLVHRVLDLVWKQLKDSAGLHSHSEEELSRLCHDSAWQVLKPFLHRFGHNYVRLETDRLAKLVSNWLQLERERPEFAVEFAEERLRAHIGPLSFKMRMDRLDRLPGGELILIDYKTGNNLSRKYWLDMPPQEPQLPLYALTIDSVPNAICFAQVRPDKMGFIGIGREQLLDGIEAHHNWAELPGQWKESLELLAQKYVDGDTRVFETDTAFGRTDSLAPLHRFAEKDQLESWLKSGGLDQ